MQNPHDHLLKGRIWINGRAMEIENEESIASVAARNGVRIEHPCGGRGVCGKCKVLLFDREMNQGQAEAAASTEHMSGEQVLACRTRARDGMRLSVPEDHRLSSRILEINDNLFALSPERMPSPFINDRGNTERKRKGMYGVALDIGTTTLAASLVDLESGSIIDSVSSDNPQSKHGGDVISRITYAMEEPDGASILHREILQATNELIARLAADALVSTDEIIHIVAAGNTTMEHCFWGVSPAPIGRAPFQPVFRKAEKRRAGELGLSVAPWATVEMVPNIAGHVGGDIVSGIYLTEMYRGKELSFLIDIGTNNEIVLGNNRFLLACSAAAGPALEGAGIKHGMRARQGAIEHIIFDEGQLRYEVVGGLQPKGICGSGLVDVISGMLEVGMLHSNGLLAGPEEASGNPYADRLTKTLGRREFRIASCEGGWLTITQKDIRQAQLAKSAVKTGVELLLEYAGCKLGDVDRIFLAGAFGTYMNLKNARRMGIVPDVSLDRIFVVGNTAGLGCARALLCEDAEDVMNEISLHTEHVEMATSPNFQEKFLRHLAFS